MQPFEEKITQKMRSFLVCFFEISEYINNFIDIIDSLVNLANFIWLMRDFQNNILYNIFIQF